MSYAQLPESRFCEVLGSERIGDYGEYEIRTLDAERLDGVPDQARAEGRAEALAEVVARLEADEAFAPNESLRQRAITTVREMGEKS